MYKILIKYSNNIKANLWELYGNSNTSTIGKTTFIEFETDDIETLKEELLKLDKEYGHENLKIIKEIEVNYTVHVIDADISDSNTPDITEDTDNIGSTEETVS